MMETIKTIAVNVLAGLIGFGAGSVGLYVLVKGLYVVVMVVGSIAGRGRRGCLAARPAPVDVSGYQGGYVYVSPWSLDEYRDLIDDPWAGWPDFDDNGVELANWSTERRPNQADVDHSLPVVQRDRETGVYWLVLSGYIDTKGGKN